MWQINEARAIVGWTSSQEGAGEAAAKHGAPADSAGRLVLCAFGTTSVEMSGQRTPRNSWSAGKSIVDSSADGRSGCAGSIVYSGVEACGDSCADALRGPRLRGPRFARSPLRSKVSPTSTSLSYERTKYYDIVIKFFYKS